jgi:putative nucleotidyltransferase with HDIG domain
MKFELFPPVDRQRLADSVSSLPSLPEVVNRVMALMRRQQVSLGELAEALSLDQALSVKVLQLANSPFYGVSGRITSIRDGINILGMRQLGTLVLAAAMTEQFKRLHGKALQLEEFWSHSVACGVAARALARQLGMDEAEAFTAGLLHDVGRLVLESCYPEEMAALIQRSNDGDQDLSELELKFLGVEHAEVGAWVCEHWKFPSDMVTSIRFHHQPPAGQQPSLTDILHVANVMVHGLETMDSGPQDQTGQPETSAWARVAPRNEALQAMLAAINQEFMGLREALRCEKESS